MADLFVGDLPVLRGVIRTRRSACWFAELVLDGDAMPSGRVAIHDGAGTEFFRGTIWDGRVVHGRVELRVLPGAARCYAPVAARFYSGPTVTIGMVVNDLMRDAGEALSATVAATVLSRPLGQWTREAAGMIDALRALADFTGLEWRTLADGTYWIGVDTFPAVDAYVDAPVLEEKPNDRLVTLGPDAIVPQLVPGTMFLDQRVSVVEHYVTGRRLRTVVMFELPGTYDSIQRLGYQSLRAAMWRVDYLALYPARVVQQDDDGTLHVVPVRFDRDAGGNPVTTDDPRLPPMTGVPIRTFVPGAVVTLVRPVPDGTRVLVGFEAGDPSRPYASLWDGEEAALATFRVHGETGIEIDAPSVKLGDAASAVLGVARTTDAVSPSESFATWLGGVTSFINGLAVGTLVPPTGSMGTITGGSTVVKAQ